MKKILKLGFVGGGIDSGIGQTHFEAMRLYTNFQLVAGCFSLNKKNNLKSGMKYGIDKSRVYSSVRELLHNEKSLDAIVLLTPVSSKYEILTQILKYKIPIISEKPLVENKSQIKLIKKNFPKSKITITFNYTGYPMVREIKNMVKKNVIGNLKKIFIEMPSAPYITRKSTRLSIAKWRLVDKAIPTIYLDLATHILHLIQFLTGKKFKNVVAQSGTDGKFNVVDDVMCFGEMSQKLKYNIWFSKSAHGYDNGLKIRLFGTNGSVFWKQIDPEILTHNTQDNETKILRRGNTQLKIANQKRYNTFKSGHPKGYCEAFGNLYLDIFNSLKNNKLSNKSNYLSSILDMEMILDVLEGIKKSAKSKKWEKI